MNKRRIKGEGSIYFDKKKDRWIGTIQLDGRRHKVVTSTADEASSRLSELRTKSTAGDTLGDGNATLANALDRWTQRGLPARKNLSPATKDVYLWCVDVWRKELGSRKLRELKVDDVERVLDRLSGEKRNDGRPLGRAALVKMRSVLGQVLDFAVRRGMVGRNVARDAELTPNAKVGERRQALTAADARLLREALEAERLGAMYTLSLSVGLRPGEAAGLLWEDVDLDAGAVRIGHAVRLENGRPTVVAELKTQRSNRTLGLPANVVEMLKRHRVQQAAERLAARRWADDRLVFSTGVGTPLSPANVRRELRRICIATNVPVVLPNELRHSAASLLSDAGVPLEQIADLLGHTTTRMLERTYRHQIRPSIDAAVDVMERVLAVH